MAKKPREVKDEPTDRTGLVDQSGGPQVEGTGTDDAADTADGEDGDDDGQDDAGDDGAAGDQPPAPPAPPAPKAPPPAKAAAPAPAYVVEASGNKSARALAILLDACELFGVNPEQDQRPVELLSWRYRPGDPREQLPESVTLVTAGGVKIVHYADPAYPMDPDTTERLRAVFGAYRKDKDGTRVPLPLPTDLTLPEGAVTGLVQSDEHVYRRGYLREGGRAEAVRRGRR